MTIIEQKIQEAKEFRQEIDRRIAVMEAAKEGKAIEAKYTLHGGTRWSQIVSGYTGYDWSKYDYRVKREPLECYVDVLENGQILGIRSKKSAAERIVSSRNPVVKTIRLREVIED